VEVRPVGALTRRSISTPAAEARACSSAYWLDKGFLVFCVPSGNRRGNPSISNNGPRMPTSRRAATTSATWGALYAYYSPSS